MRSAPVPVIVVDDHAGFRHAASAVVAAADGFELAGEAYSGEHAIEVLKARSGEVLVLMDLNMPGLDGIETTRAVRASNPSAAVLLVSSYGPADVPSVAASCGAIGYLSKELLTPTTLAEAWRRVQRGHRGGEG